MPNVTTNQYMAGMCLPCVWLKKLEMDDMGEKGNPKMSKYTVVMASLIDRINRGEFEANMILPTESDLIHEYGVSRITVRKALDELESQDYIFRKQGKGTFINQIGADERYNGMHKFGLGGVIRNTGKNMKRVQLEKRICPAGDIGSILNLGSEDPVLFYQRVYTADTVPVFFAESTINHMSFPGIENYDYNFISLTVLQKRIYNAKLYWENREMHSTKAGRSAEYLDLASDDPVLYLTYLSYLKNENSMIPFEWMKLFVRTDVIPLNSDLFDMN